MKGKVTGALFQTDSRWSDEACGNLYLCLVAVAAITILSAAIVSCVDRAQKKIPVASAKRGSQ